MKETIIKFFTPTFRKGWPINLSKLLVASVLLYLIIDSTEITNYVWIIAFGLFNVIATISSSDHSTKEWTFGIMKKISKTKIK